MTPLEHLGVVEELARNSAPYSEFRMHLIAIQKALEAFAKLEPEHAKFKTETAKEIADMRTKYKDLLFQHMELKSGQKNDPPDSNWPSSGLRHDI